MSSISGIESLLEKKIQVFKFYFFRPLFLSIGIVIIKDFHFGCLKMSELISEPFMLHNSIS